MSVVAAFLAFVVQPVGDLPDIRWTPEGSRDRFSFSTDPDSVRPMGDRIRYRIRLDGPMSSPPGAATAIATVEIDCRTGLGTWLEGRFFNASGVLLETRSVTPAGRRSEAPPLNSPEARIQDRLCNTRDSSD
jgi:hypothetical protein